MKIKVTKIAAAKSQLLESINLHFEERDPVSVHTLAGAALQILQDHFTAEQVHAYQLPFHYNSPFIKEDKRSFWFKSINAAKNFFKHADNDIKQGKDHIEFSPDLNDLYIFETIRLLTILEKTDYLTEPEFRVFCTWFIQKYPDSVNENERAMALELSKYRLGSLKDYHEFIVEMKEHPENFESLEAA